MRSLTKLILVIVIGIIICFVAVVYLIRPSMGQVAKLNQELREKKAESKTLEQQILAFKTAQSDLAKAVEKERILNAIIDREGLVNPVVNLENAVRASGSEHELSIENDLAGTTPGARVPVAKVLTGNYPGVKEVPFTLSIKNDYVGMIEFLQYVENSPYLTEFVNLELYAETSANAGTDNDHTGRVIGTLKGVFYIKNDETGTK